MLRRTLATYDKYLKSVIAPLTPVVEPMANDSLAADSLTATTVNP